MAASAAAQMSAVIQAQLLPQVQGYRLKQAQVNSCIDQLLQMDTAASMAPLMVDKVSRQFAAASELLAELTDTINSTIALTRHRRTQARRWHLTDIPANPMSIILALSDLITIAHLKSAARPIRNALRPIVRRLRLPKAIKRWMLVGRYVAFRRPTGQQDGTLELFRHTNEIRVIRSEPTFTIAINPPLPLPTGRPVHPFSQHPFTHHAKPHDPPVRSRIVWHAGVGWGTVGANDGPLYASASSMLKGLLLSHRLLAVGGFTDSPAVVVDRRVRGGHLDRIMTQSLHRPLDECSLVLAFEWANGVCGHSHVLTSSNDPFIAWILFRIQPGDHRNVRVIISTSEAAATGVAHDAPFAQRFPLTAARVRPALDPIAAIVLDGQAP
ncbi:unnamed protein product [Vitrella brassicaformis CCMP3155]|uniref:Uncharacterized protein n=1 Tax=Vitrella brassicaformis (strain CCMP3155) TaxID=1169540 RepID=A0A0G4H112_VITBC|nr:unnamed protein product [Vitrella brassicaformis CCMP3155]|eukprot:CEM37216.1 unnamed protein product [Vitrella brassicaformis CCMP3155]